MNKAERELTKAGKRAISASQKRMLEIIAQGQMTNPAKGKRSKKTSRTRTRRRHAAIPVLLGMFGVLVIMSFGACSLQKDAVNKAAEYFYGKKLIEGNSLDNAKEILEDLAAEAGIGTDTPADTLDAEVTADAPDLGTATGTATAEWVTSIPAWEGQPYVYVNGNMPFFTAKEITAEAFENYSPLDEYGRVGVATACLGSETMPKEGEERGDISDVKPTGWAQEKYNFIDNGWLYNRCHLIAWSLSAENANEENLMTGTRYLNIEGMWPVEETVMWYLRENPQNHVMYRVTPVFEGKNLLASGVLMEAFSVEDSGAGVQFCVYCYNVEPNIEIDYTTGENFPEY